MQSERDQEVASNQAQNVSSTMLSTSKAPLCKDTEETIIETPSSSTQSNACQSITQQQNTAEPNSIEINEKPNIQRPSDLLSSTIDTKTNVKDDATTAQKQINATSTSLCNQCYEKCLCDKKLPKSSQIKCDVIDNDENDIKINKTDISISNPMQSISLASNTSTSTTTTTNSIRKLNMNKSVGPMSSPPNVPIFVNRFPNNHPTILPKHIRYFKAKKLF